MARPPQVVRWKSLDALLDAHPRASQLKQYVADVSEGLSDHMPVVARFFFVERD